MNRTLLKWIRATFVLVLIAGLSSVRAQVRSSLPEMPNFDKRAGTKALSFAPGTGITPGARAAAAMLEAEIPGARVDFDKRLGTPGWIASRRGFLTGPAGQKAGVTGAAMGNSLAADPDGPTGLFVQGHRELFGFGPEVLARARLKEEMVGAHNGLRTVVWEQELEGIPVFEGLLISHTTREGELVNISSHFLAEPGRAADTGTPNRAALQAAPGITARQALALAAQTLAEPLKAEAVAPAASPAQGPERQQRLVAPGLNGQSDARLVWLPLNSSAMRLCWQVILTSRARGEMFRVLIDAETGEALVRHCLTAYLSPATYRVYTSDSPSPHSPGNSTPITNQPPLVSRSLVTLSALDTNASPAGWIDDGVNETIGNNVDAHADCNGDDEPDLPRPQGSPWRVFDFTLDLSQNPSHYTNAAVVQLFYWNNWMHDQLYALGFTEAAGNFQSNNFGRGGLGDDAVLADAQDGDGWNNANFSSPPDGLPGRMQMYLWTGPTPFRDGDLDAEVVLHEYTHGLSNRRVGGGVGISALQSAGMGEGWSDFYALSLLSEAGDDVNGVYACGAYASYLGEAGYLQNYYFGVRRYPYTTDLGKNPLTLKDIDPAQADYCSSSAPYNAALFGTCSTDSADEVHSQGEVWCVTLWEVRANLINRYGWATGNHLALQLVTDGMALSPANPTFVQARDAILQADWVDNGGADRNELWAGFARRGLGLSATVPDSSTTAGVIEAFDVPTADRFTLGPVNSPQYTCQPFTLTVTALDAFSRVASNYVGPVNLSGQWSGSVTNTILGDLGYSSYDSGSFTFGYSFTPSTNLTITHVRSFSGTKVSIWTDYGTYRASQTVSGPAGAWTETPLLSPLKLSAGIRYRVGFYTGGGAYYYTNSGASVFPYGTIDQGYYCSGDGFPTLSNSMRWCLVDLRYTVGFGGTASLTPTVSGAFTNGVWSGNVSVLAPAPNVVLKADDGAGHTGLSGPFDVQLANDLGLAVADTPRPVALGGNLTCSILVTNTGPLPATAVNLTNLLSATATLVSVSVSQGSWATNGSVVSCNLGTLAGPGSALVTLVETANQLAAVTNQVTVTRAETDPDPANNTATTVTPVVVPAISINDVSLLEGNSGTTSAVFTASVSPPPGQAVTVNYATGNGTAIAPGDYLGTNGILTFSPGQTTQTIVVTIIGDTLYESNETFYVTLSNPTNAILARSQGVGTILNDDPMPAFSISDVTLLEGNVGITNAVFTVTLSGPSGLASTVSYNTRDGTALGGSDYVAQSGTLTLPPGVTTTNLILSIIGDTLVQPDEVFYVDLSSPVNATMAKGEAVCTILNDDGLPGQADHFVWGAIASPQHVDVPFAVTITALDASNNPAVNFNGTVSVTPGLTPSTAGPFTNGVWSGHLTTQQVATNLSLHADDGNGHTGASDPFNVLLWNDLALTVSASVPTAFVGQNVTYSLTVSNLGPSAATGVMLTNSLPASLSPVSATASQGSFSHAGNSYWFLLGSLATGEAAQITLTGMATAAGSITNFASVVADQPDLVLSNNDAASVTTVLPRPVLGYAVTGRSLALTWSGAGVLQCATNAAGPYSDVPNAVSPYSNSFDTARQVFFRLRD